MTALVTVLLFAAFAGTTPAQNAKPNFSGTWLLVAPAEAAVQPPGQEETISQTSTTITFGHPSEGGGHRMAYRLDGQETENEIAGMRSVCRASWQGSALVLIDKQGSKETTKTIHIDQNGSLVMEIKPPIEGLPGGPGKLVFRKR
jgi:hypothetical protein